MSLAPTTHTPDRLFERPWRPGHPFGPRPSRGRTWAMGCLLLLLCSLIGGYLYVTDSDRVRAMAQSYLSGLLGGRVEVGRATLSIFEGLRLADVRVYVDEDPEADAPDSVLFSAQSFLVRYDPRVLLAGRIEATQIVAIDPHVRVTENVDAPLGPSAKRWNYQRMIREPRPATVPSDRPARPLVLPEVLLRNAQVEYSEIRGGQLVSLGSLNIEGRLTPSSDQQRYAFTLQSRGETEGIGPAVSGSFDRETRQVVARLERFEFGRDIRTMLPAEVRQWWEDHGLSGRVNVPYLSYAPPRGGQPAKFKVETELDGVTLDVRPEAWMSRHEVRHRAGTRWAYTALAALSRAGLGARGAGSPDGEPSFPAAAWPARMAESLELSPVQLQRVSGRYVFTNDGISLENVSGRIENNAFTINGRIDGYSPQSTARITLASPRSEHVYIPAAPRYVRSLPRQVQEIYNHLRPHGTCDLVVEVVRSEPGERPEVSGHLTIVDGNFVFDKFPYPVRRATGKIVFGRDPRTGWDRIDIVDVRGFGVAGGPNADRVVTVRGVIAPLTNEVGVDLRIEAPDAESEPAITAALPPEVRAAVDIFDPTGTGAWPTFRGGFKCDVLRPVGRYSRWSINVDIDLADAAGRFVHFPYPLEHVTGRIEVRDGYVDLRDVRMNRPDGAALAIDGRVSWKEEAERLADARRSPHEKPATRPTTAPTIIRPKLRVVARNVPIDRDLLAALPPDQRGWLERLGLSGVLDFDGRVFRRDGYVAPDDFGIEHAFDITLRDGTAWPAEGTFAASDVAGRMHLTGDGLELTELTGRRGGSDLTGRGTITWADGAPRVDLSGGATNLVLDSALYQALPGPARAAWDAVRPDGTIDVDVRYKTGSPGAPLARKGGTSPEPTRANGTTADAGPLASVAENGLAVPAPAGDGSAGASPSRAAPAPFPATRPADSELELTLRPRKLAVNLAAVPYRLTDLAGAVTVRGGAVALADVTGRHGDATVRVSGTGDVGTERSLWDLKLAGEDVPVDDDLRRAVPAGVASMAEMLSLDGVLSFDFPRLVVRGDLSTPATHPASRPSAAEGAGQATAGAIAPTTLPSTFEMDFAARFTTPRASLDVGVPLTEVNGAVDVAGTVRAGELDQLAAVVAVESLKVADRPARAFRTNVRKPAGEDTLAIGPLQGELAGGEVAGEVHLSYPDVGPSRYGISLVLRGADVKQLAGDVEASQDLSGRLGASLALEGEWESPDSRRGRGEVDVEGREMYKIPLVLGLLQVTNLALPISSPFNQGSAAYSVNGQRVTFETIELRSNSMLMQGRGHLDFGTKQVKMTFTTDNPNWPKLPLIGDLVQGAKHELLQFHVRGTLAEPTVKAAPANTFMTTVDEVLRGSGEK